MHALDDLFKVGEDIVSIGELDLLPVGAVVYAADYAGAMERFAIGWAQVGNHVMHDSNRVPLPAKLLYLPDIIRQRTY